MLLFMPSSVLSSVTFFLSVLFFVFYFVSGWTIKLKRTCKPMVVALCLWIPKLLDVMVVEFCCCFNSVLDMFISSVSAASEKKRTITIM